MGVNCLKLLVVTFCIKFCIAARINEAYTFQGVSAELDQLKLITQNDALTLNGVVNGIKLPPNSRLPYILESLSMNFVWTFQELEVLVKDLIEEYQAFSRASIISSGSAIVANKPITNGLAILNNLLEVLTQITSSFSQLNSDVVPKLAQYIHAGTQQSAGVPYEVVNNYDLLLNKLQNLCSIASLYNEQFKDNVLALNKRDHAALIKSKSLQNLQQTAKLVSIAKEYLQYLIKIVLNLRIVFNEKSLVTRNVDIKTSNVLKTVEGTMNKLTNEYKKAGKAMASVSLHLQNPYGSFNISSSSFITSLPKIK